MAPDVINRFLAETNNNLKPFAWAADPAKIIADVRSLNQVLDSVRIIARALRNGYP